ncbi:MAG: MTH938/NDUFAF3 family protein [Candidatus Marinimicrobia bacterium]|jgi:hypothetical protein|nr:MTH938/NDUFAF3 family protein [Candidatus Neomarinimicrobiota bacterium]|tara:strand:+ start:120 stop:470 length:351 start_codon:yes stop_codon:yes gene_type:complete
MKLQYDTFGKIIVDGQLYLHDVIVDRMSIGKRQKKKSKHLRSQYGHTPLGPDENIPWDCEELVIGTGFYGRLPITDEVFQAAERKGVEIKIMKTAQACSYLVEVGAQVNAVLHVTC